MTIWYNIKINDGYSDGDFGFFFKYRMEPKDISVGLTRVDIDLSAQDLRRSCEEGNIQTSGFLKISKSSTVINKKLVKDVLFWHFTLFDSFCFFVHPRENPFSKKRLFFPFKENNIISGDYLPSIPPSIVCYGYSLFWLISLAFYVFASVRKQKITSFFILDGNVCVCIIRCFSFIYKGNIYFCSIA